MYLIITTHVHGFYLVESKRFVFPPYEIRLYHLYCIYFCIHISRNIFAKSFSFSWTNVEPLEKLILIKSVKGDKIID